MFETAVHFFLAALALMVVVIVLELYKRKIIKKERQDEKWVETSYETGMTMCLSPDCIRCTRNRDVLQNAITKLSYYAEEYINVLGVNDLEQISLDIKKSISRLKSQRHHHFLPSSSEVKGSMPVVFKLSGLMEEEVWPSSDFPALQLLDHYFKNISLEFSHLFKSPLSETQYLWKTNNSATGKWQIVQLVDQGRRTKAADLCPVTMEVLQKIPGFMHANVFGDASFSVVHPGTEIARHCGSTNIRIRCHLGLQVPKGECFLQVGSKTCHWEEGKLICFNDAFPHSVHHKGGNNSAIRAVFMFDIWHPDVTESQKKILNFAFGV